MAFWVGDSTNRRGSTQSAALSVVSVRSCILGPIAIDAWLREFESSEKTLRSYTREIERFYLWLAALQRKGLASSRQEDLKAYTAFMEAPPADWCGDRYNRRGTSAWRAC